MRKAMNEHEHEEIHYRACSWLRRAMAAVPPSNDELSAVLWCSGLKINDLKETNERGKYGPVE
jgi:hypothetical protein